MEVLKTKRRLSFYSGTNALNAWRAVLSKRVWDAMAREGWGWWHSDVKMLRLSAFLLILLRVAPPPPPHRGGGGDSEKNQCSQDPVPSIRGICSSGVDLMKSYLNICLAYGRPRRWSVTFCRLNLPPPPPSFRINSPFSRQGDKFNCPSSWHQIVVVICGHNGLIESYWSKVRAP